MGARIIRRSIDEILPEVRTAYRIVAAYQKRILHICDYIVGRFPEFEFDFWGPEHWALPHSRKLLPSQGKWTVDALPLYSFSIILTEPNFGYAIEILHCADTGLDDIEDYSDFDVTNMDDIEDTTTTLSLIGWRMTGLSERQNWRKVYGDCSWPEDDDILEQTEIEGVENIRRQIGVEDLRSREDIDQFVDSFRKRVREFDFPT